MVHRADRLAQMKDGVMTVQLTNLRNLSGDGCREPPTAAIQLAR